MEASNSVGTFSQVYLHFIFAVKFRDGLLLKTFQDEVYRYIAGIVQNNGHKLISVGGMPDHIHILVGMKPNQSVADLVNKIKSNSSKFINEKRFLPVRFEWQRGYGVFSYSRSQLNQVVHYIQNQEAHHKKKSFRAEYVEFLEKFQVEFDERFLFNELV
ncbi:REP element-mobilizing transposase RayT [Cruoricaptor ignavus]|uniref:REP element-mobilizing transposase RayT n=1 Tax=Cruoricaptor ignavus TaxID=1118202 RepID=A0A1M6C860_9FLAO|nr:IS200/IS605 family transposase [Cruoricaptor ignavus]SHI57200.1 REP element-mobilizing transposase RayT [Cruoricaptor ignavus]